MCAQISGVYLQRKCFNIKQQHLVNSICIKTYFIYGPLFFFVTVEEAFASCTSLLAEAIAVEDILEESDPFRSGSPLQITNIKAK